MTENKTIYVARFQGLNNRKLDAQSKLICNIFGYDTKIISDGTGKNIDVEMTFASDSSALTVDSLPVILEIRKSNVTLEKTDKTQIR